MRAGPRTPPTATNPASHRPAGSLKWPVPVARRLRRLVNVRPSARHSFGGRWSFASEIFACSRSVSARVNGRNQKRSCGVCCAVFSDPRRSFGAGRATRGRRFTTESSKGNTITAGADSSKGLDRAGIGDASPIRALADIGSAGDRRCADCGLSCPLLGSICHACSSSADYQQEQEQEQEQEQASSSEIRNAPSRARPVGNSDDDGPEIYWLEALYHRGELRPMDAKLGPLPPQARHVMRAIYDHIGLRIGLRLAVGETRPLPYATSEAVKAGHAKDQSSASKAIIALVKFGSIEHVGQLPPLRPGHDGTKLYAPPAGGDSA